MSELEILQSGASVILNEIGKRVIRLTGIVAPNAGAGVVAPVGSVYYKLDGTTIESSWKKTDVGDTDWTEEGGGAGITAAYKLKNVVSPYTITAADIGFILIFNESTLCEINIPDQATLDLIEGFNFNFRNKNPVPGQIKINQAVGDFLVGAGNQTLTSSKVGSCYLETKVPAATGSTWVTAGDMETV